MRFQRSKGSFSPTSFSFTVYNRSVKITKEGGFFIIMVIGIGFASINTGINLLYLILAMCLSFIIVSGILSELTLRNIYVSHTMPEEVFAEQPFPVQIEIKNNKKWFPTYSIWLEKDIEDIEINKNVSLKQADGKTNFKIPKLYVYQVKAGDSEKKSALWVFPNRGLVKFKGIKISTSYPFGFFIKTALVNLPDEKVVFPAIKTNQDFSEKFERMGEITSINKGEGSDILSFRGFTHGDSSKMVHWKTSAKANKLMIKEHFEDESRKVVIFFDNRINNKSRIDLSNACKQFEEGVRQAASLANYFIREGYQVKMTTHSQNIPFGSGLKHLYRIFYHLALLEPVNKITNPYIQPLEYSNDVVKISYSGEIVN